MERPARWLSATSGSKASQTGTTGRPHPSDARGLMFPFASKSFPEATMPLHRLCSFSGTGPPPF